MEVADAIVLCQLFLCALKRLFSAPIADFLGRHNEFQMTPTPRMEKT